MGESGSQQRPGPGGQDDGEMIQFGGIGPRWPFPRIHLPPMPRLPSPSRVSVTVALAALAIGLLAGFIGGRLTAHHGGHKAPARSPALAIGLTGARCAAQVGRHLELGVEVMNQTRSSVTLGAIRPMFPLGGLRTIASGIGSCGELRGAEIASPASLSPGATEWVHATVAVSVGCPQALPVWFKVGYSSAGRTYAAVLPGFPDLSPVSYRHCRSSDQNTSAFIAVVEDGRSHSSSG